MCLRFSLLLSSCYCNFFWIHIYIYYELWAKSSQTPYAECRKLWWERELHDYSSTSSEIKFRLQHLWGFFPSFLPCVYCVHVRSILQVHRRASAERHSYCFLCNLWQFWHSHLLRKLISRIFWTSFWSGNITLHMGSNFQGKKKRTRAHTHKIRAAIYRDTETIVLHFFPCKNWDDASTYWCRWDTEK